MTNGEWGPIDNQCESANYSCGVAKDAFGTWPDSPAGTRVELECSTGYHGTRIRECSADGHWGPVWGECFHECYDILPRDQNADGDLQIFRNRANFLAYVRNDSEELERTADWQYKFTCGNSYGRPGKGTYVASLRNWPNKLQVCADNASARKNCPEICDNPKCSTCKDGDAPFPFFYAERNREVQLRCQDA